MSRKFITLILLFRIINFVISDEAKHETEAAEGEFPYIVSVRRYNSHICGGTIINAKHILTSAHYLHGSFSQRLSIQYGITKYNTSDNNAIPVKTFFIHKSYKQLNNYATNDIAILRLKKPITFNRMVQPVKLPKLNQEIVDSTTGTVIVWGHRDTDGKLIKSLQKVNIYIYPDAQCSAVHKSSFNRSLHICGGLPGGKKCKCYADGPLIIKGYQVGIVSWGVQHCAIKGYSGLFTKVSHFLDWIKSKIEETVNIPT